MSNTSTESVRKAAAALVVGGLLTAIFAAISLSAQASTSVSDELWSYPWSGGTFVVIALLYSILHVLVIVGLLGLRRSGMAGPGRAAAVGLAVAAAGTALLLVGELASIPIRDHNVDDTSSVVVGSAFGLGSLLSAIGLILAGRATLQAGRWDDWRRFTPFAAGLVTLVLVGLGPTKFLAAGIIVYGLCLLAVGAALYTRPTASNSAGQPEPRSGVQVVGAERTTR